MTNYISNYNYIISYDAPAGTNYQPFYDAIHTRNSARLLESVWLIATTLTAVEEKDWVQGLLGSNVSIAVIEIQGHWCIDGVDPKALGWLKKQL